MGVQPWDRGSDLWPRCLSGRRAGAEGPHPGSGTSWMEVGTGPSLTSRSSLATSLSSRRMPSSCPMTIFMRCRIRSRSPPPPLLGSLLGCPRSGAPRMFIIYHVAVGLPILAPAGHSRCLPPRSPPKLGSAPHLNGPPAHPGPGWPSPGPLSWATRLFCHQVGKGGHPEEDRVWRGRGRGQGESRASRGGACRAQSVPTMSSGDPVAAGVPAGTTGNRRPWGGP